MASGNRSSIYNITARLEGIDAVVSGFDRMTFSAGRAGQRIENSAQRAQKEWDMMNSTFSRVYKGIERLSSARMEIGGIWRQGASDLRVYTDETRKLLREQEKFKALGKSQQENERAFKAVRDTVGQIKGLRLDKTTADLTDLNTAFGNLDMAIQALPAFSKFRFGLESIFGEDVAASKIEAMVKSGAKFLEVIGKIKATGPVDPNTGLATFLERDRQEMEKFLNVLVKGSSASGGAVSMTDMLTMARTGKTSVKSLSPEGLATLMTLMPEKGAPQTGTAMMSLFQNIVAGKMPISGMNRLAQLGMVDPKRVELNKSKNKIIKLLPGAIKGSDLLMDDPLKFADEFAKVLATRGGEKGKGIDTTDLKAVSAEIAAIIRDRTAQDLLVTLITARNSILSQKKTLFEAKGTDQLYSLGADSVEGKLKQFENAVDNFRAEVGGPLVNALTSAAQGAKPFLDFLLAHPTATLMALAIGKIGTSVIQTAAVLKMSGIGGLFQRGSAGALPTATLSGREQWDALFSSSQARTAGTSAGRSAGIGMGTGLIAGLGVGLGVLGITEIISTYLRHDNIKQAAAEAGIEIGQLLRGGIDQDLSKLPEDARAQAVRAEMEAKAKQLGALRAKRMSLGDGPATFSWFENLTGFGAVEPEMLRWLRTAGGMKGMAPSNSDQTAFKYGTEGNREETALKFLVDHLKNNETIGSVAELKSFLDTSRNLLEKGGAPELFAVLERVTQQAFPELSQKLAQQAAAQDELARKYGYTGDRVNYLGEAADQAAAKLRNIGGTTEGEETAPIEKRKRGGMVMRPTRALIGEAGPEWIVPFGQTLDMLADGGGNPITVNTPVTINVNGSVDPSVVQEIRRQSRAGVRAGAEEIYRVIERMHRNNDQLR